MTFLIAMNEQLETSKISHWRSQVAWLNAVFFLVVVYKLWFHLSNLDGLER